MKIKLDRVVVGGYGWRDEVRRHYKAGEQMRFESKLSPGDVAWVVGDEYIPIGVTIGRVKITHTDSPGVEGREAYSNYSAQKEYKEEYMAVETGIGSGRVFTLGGHLFETEEECQGVCDEREKKHKEQILENELSSIKSLRRGIKDFRSALKYKEDKLERLEIELKKRKEAKAATT